MNLQELSLARLKEIAAELNIVPAGDKRKKTTWIAAIENHQVTIEPVSRPTETKAQITLNDPVNSQSSQTLPLAKTDSLDDLELETVFSNQIETTPEENLPQQIETVTNVGIYLLSAIAFVVGLSLLLLDKFVWLILAITKHLKLRLTSQQPSPSQFYQEVKQLFQDSQDRQSQTAIA